MYLADNLEADLDEEWEKNSSDAKVGIANLTAAHETKFDIINYGFNNCWQEIISFRRWMPVDESQVVKGYKNMMTWFPKSKPISTGLILCSLYFMYHAPRGLHEGSSCWLKCMVVQKMIILVTINTIIL